MAEPQTEVMCRLVTRVQKLMELHKLTKTDLAKKSGMTREQISRILNGHHECTLSTLEKIAKGFGVSMSDLIEPEKKPKKTA